MRIHLRLVKKYIIGIGLVGLLGVSALATISIFNHPAVRGGYTAEYWSAQLQRGSPSIVAADFAQDARGYDQSTQHGMAHAFGTALYRTLGAQGISFCDTNFSYGCFHAFIASQIVAEGLSSVPSFPSVCAHTQAPTGCLHGVGHGLIGYVGYDSASLHKVLSLCASDVKDTSGGGCMAGAFMEYNLRTMAYGDGAAHVRDLGKDNGIFFCTTLDAKYEPLCMFLLPQAWYAEPPSQTEDEATIFMNRIALRCAQAGSLVYACAAGTGRGAAVLGGYDVRKAGELCDSGYGTEIENRLYCRAFAGNVLLSDIRTENVAPTICDVFSGTEHEKCLNLLNQGDTIFDIQNSDR